ncbi:MAG: L,D-transpeptidase family protein [Gammaproteobacteria bacterium]|nr:L,D-transpeptidase family protein [Gammaproteobacteria bacterium]
MPGEFILPPGERVGVVLNLAEQRLYYYQPDGKTVVTYPVGIGRADWQTPPGEHDGDQGGQGPELDSPASIRREHAAMGDPLPAVVPPGRTIRWARGRSGSRRQAT